MTDEDIETVARSICTNLGVDPDERVGCGCYDDDTPAERDARGEFYFVPAVMRYVPRWRLYRAKAAETIAVRQIEPAWTSRLIHIEQWTPIERQCADLKVAIEDLGAHPLLTEALNAVDLAMRTLGKWHDDGETGATG